MDSDEARSGLAELERRVEEDWQADLEARRTGLYRAEVRSERLMRPLMEAAGFAVGVRWTTWRKTPILCRREHAGEGGVDENGAAVACRPMIFPTKVGSFNRRRKERAATRRRHAARRG